METLQGTYGDGSKEVTLLKLLPDEQNCLVNGMKFGLIHAIKAVEAVFESLVFVHEGTSVDP
jgi:hypothetical protein